MKKVMFSLISMLILMTGLWAQKPSLTVVNFDSQGVEYTPDQLGSIARMEMEKLDQFEVMDRYDVNYLVKKHELELNGCYGKICLNEIGELIGTDKIMSGSVELFGETIVLSLRLINVNENRIEKTQVMEFLNVQHEIRTLMEVSIREMFGLENNPDLMAQLTREDQYENKIVNPEVDRLNLSGPRFGFTFFNGSSADVISAKKADGGFDGRPYLMYNLGYQFEVQYLNAGKLQALFEIIPTITGLEQGLFLPTVNVLHGLRHNINGLEVAVGLSLGVTPQAEGYYDDQGNWNLADEWTGEEPNPNPLENRLDRRGDLRFSSGLVIAAGKSFKSGRMNIPVNLFVVPSPFGTRYGISVGFNARKNR